MVVVWVVIAVVVLAVLYVVYRFNRLVRLRTRTQEAWSDIDVELRRRHDLIPNLVSTVQGYAAHERQVLENVTAARTQAVNVAQTGDPRAMAGAEDALTGAVRQLMAVAENYPQLRAAELFLNLQEQLTTTEDKVEFARRFYNGNVRDFNTALQRFPTNVIGNRLGFKPFTFFAAAEGDRAVPSVQFPSAAPS
ncbi:MAG: LemA family protein [Candidatus Dormibacteraeota bacterium]|nr:LemA family protein [Candidatus Dormibacteraeota bacterium]